MVKRVSWQKEILLQIVHFYQSDSSGVDYTANDRRVVACWQICDDCRFPSVACDNPADDRSLPVIIRGYQNPCAIVQFQRRISQYVRHSKLSELRANGTNNDHLWLHPLDDEASNHHVVGCLDKAASADVAKD